MFKKIILLLTVLLIPSLFISGCGGDGDDSGGMYACSYEKRVTDGCDGYGFGQWEADCYQFNADDYYITPEQVCSNVTSGGLYCAAGCCIDSEFQNVILNSGTCP